VIQEERARRTGANSAERGGRPRHATCPRRRSKPIAMQTNFTGDSSPAYGESDEACEVRLRSAAFLSDATRLLLTPDLRTSLDAIAHLTVPYLADLCAIDLDHDGARERLVVTGIMNGVEVPVPDRTRRASVHHEPWGMRLVVPLAVGERMLGALTLAVSGSGHFTEAQRGVARALGRRMALALDNERRYQQVRDEVAGRDEFLSIATHEIRGALTSMRLAVQGLLRGSLPAAAAQTALEVIQREDRRLGRFVDDLLDVARMRTGQLHFEMEQVDLGAVVRDVVARLTADIPAGGSPVSVATDGNLVGRWDRGRLEQAVTNLLANAIKYGEGQPIAVTAVDTGDVARITVADSGIGIRPELLPRIFNPFQRGVDARTYGGLGLGLHIVRTIVEGLGGAITVESRPGAGSTFTVDLPMTKER
jgi:signal transduction histidine kinase